jgi:hypothetical protein
MPAADGNPPFPPILPGYTESCARGKPHALSGCTMQSTFTHKFLMMVAAGFAAACMFWVFRHIVQEAFYESSNAGWKDSLHGGTAEHPRN